MKGGIDLRTLSRSFVVLILFISLGLIVTPAHAQVTITALDWTTTTAQMGAVIVNHVRVTNVDPINVHSVTLSIVGYAGGWWWGSFSPTTLSVPPGGSLDSTLTTPLPGPGDVCPGENTPGPYYIQLTVQGSDPAVGTIAGPTLTINLLPTANVLSVNIEASKGSYMKGETVTLNMEANLPAQYYLVVKKPDGSNWASAQGFLPATFTKTVSDPLGTYTAELSAYYGGMSATAFANFAVTPDTYDVTISLVGLPPDATTALLVDGNKATDMKGGDVKVLSYPIGTSHTFQVDQYVNGASGYRYYCESDSWTANGAASNPFNYATQVYLDVSTDPTGVTNVTASDWSARGSSISISAVPAEVEGTEGTKYELTTWTVDGTPRSGNGFTVVMDAPHKVVAKYDTMFLLTIVSDYGNPKGAGYYKSGETATFSVDSPVGIGIQRVFVEWMGDYTGNNPKGSVTMDGPKTTTATWTTGDFQLLIPIGVTIVVVFTAVLFFRRKNRSVLDLQGSPRESGLCLSCGHRGPPENNFCEECGRPLRDETRVY